MEDIFGLILLLSLAGLILGLIKPSLSLFWIKAKATRKQAIILYSLLFIVSFIAFGIVTDSNASKISGTETVEETTPKQQTSALPGFLDVEKLKTALALAPNNYSSWTVKEFNDTNYICKGYKHANDDPYGDHVVIQYNPKSSEIYFAGLYAISDNLDARMDDVKKISDFAVSLINMLLIISIAILRTSTLMRKVI